MYILPYFIFPKLHFHIPSVFTTLFSCKLMRGKTNKNNGTKWLIKDLQPITLESLIATAHIFIQIYLVTQCLHITHIYYQNMNRNDL